MGTVRREHVIDKYVRGRDVLDLGGIDHCYMDHKLAQEGWLHALIARNARSCVGLDILEERVSEARDRGFNFVVGNAENMSFEDQFDVVVAGEFVEHVYNLGLVLDGAWKALRPSGHLILTTPNNFALSKMVYAALFGRESCHPEHTCWYSRQTLSYILSRHGFEPVETHVLGRESRFTLLTSLYDTMAAWRPILAETLVIVGVRQNSQDKYSNKW